MIKCTGCIKKVENAYLVYLCLVKEKKNTQVNFIFKNITCFKYQTLLRKGIGQNLSFEFKKFPIGSLALQNFSLLFTVCMF